MKNFIEVDVNGNALFNAERHQISVLRCCEEWCSPDKKIERRTRGYCSLHFIIGGKGTLVYEVNGQRQEVVLQKGDSFFAETFSTAIRPFCSASAAYLRRDN